MQSLLLAMKFESNSPFFFFHGNIILNEWEYTVQNEMQHRNFVDLRCYVYKVNYWSQLIFFLPQFSLVEKWYTMT